MSEKNVYATLRRNLLKGHDRIDRLENLVGTGMPDVNYCSEGVECWIEIKAPTYEPKRETTALLGSNHKLSQAQKNWFLRQENAGGNAWILLATEKHWYLLDGSYSDRINTAGIGYIEFWADWHAPFPLEKGFKFIYNPGKIGILCVGFRQKFCNPFTSIQSIADMIYQVLKVNRVHSSTSFSYACLAIISLSCRIMT